MNVPPTSTAATQISNEEGHTTLASAAAPNAADNLIRRPRKLQNKTEDAAAKATTIQITGSSSLVARVARTIATGP